MISVAFVDPVTKEQRKLINDTFDMAIKALKQEPKTGHWIKQTEHVDQCSECELMVIKTSINNYCPNCGAKMKGEQEC